MTDPVVDFMALFDGRRDAYGTGHGRWIKAPLTASVYAEHVRGAGPGLGVAPLRDDGMVSFAAIDLDEPDFEAAVTMARMLPGPSWIERSRSGNAHVWVFFDGDIEAWVVRGILKEAIMAAGKGAVEVFPKQDKLGEGMVGNYINLPYHGDARPVLAWHAQENAPDGPDVVQAGTDNIITEDGTSEVVPIWGTPLPVEVFVNMAMQRRNSPDEWRRRAQWLMIEPPEERDHHRDQEFGTQKNLHMCAEWIIGNRDENPVTCGHRAAVYFSLAKMLSNYEGFDHDESLNLMRLVNDSSPDTVPDPELRRILANAERGRFTSTDCDNPLVQPFAHPECPIAHPRR